MEGMITTLYFWRREKNKEVLMCFCVFLERNMVRKERKKMPKIAPKNPIFQFWSNLGCQGLFIALGMLPEARRTL